MKARMGVTLTMLVAAAAFAVIVAREPHWPTEAVRVASTYVHALQNDDDIRALAMTGLSGSVRDRFALDSHRQLCARTPMTVVSTHPPQTVGNRWRRWLSDRPIEPDVITVRLENRDVPCLLAVSVRPRPQGGWQVSGFQSTAG